VSSFEIAHGLKPEFSKKAELIQNFRKHTSGAKQAAEKLEYLGNGKGKHPSGAEAQIILPALSARVKLVP
jgi:hypothetical protein